MALSCPHCGMALRADGSAWRCANRHAFDCGKHGDVNLLLPQHKRSRQPGDSKPMVAARRDFLASGAYQPIAERVAKYVLLLAQGLPVYLADAGCGEGYYLRQIQRLCYPQADTAAGFIGWDISKFTVQSAAKQATFPAQWLTASSAHIPLADNSVDVLLSLFGFEVPQEFARVLKPQGYLVTADAGERHLIEIRERIYPDLKPYRPKPAVAGLSLLKQEGLSYEITLSQPQLAQLLLMTPHFFRTKAEAKAQLLDLPALSVTVEVVFRIYANE